MSIAPTEFDKGSFCQKLEGAANEAMERADLEYGTLYRDPKKDPLQLIIESIRGVIRRDFMPGYLSVKYHGGRFSPRIGVHGPEKITVGTYHSVSAPFRPTDPPSVLIGFKVVRLIEVMAVENNNFEKFTFEATLLHPRHRPSQDLREWGANQWTLNLRETKRSQTFRSLGAALDNSLSVQTAVELAEKGLRNPLQAGAPGLGKRA